MDYFEPKTIVIAVSTMVFLAIVLDFLRRKKRNRYENLQMSSREINRSSRYEYEEDPFSDSQFPSGGSRVVGRDIIRHRLKMKNKTHFSISLNRLNLIGTIKQLRKNLIQSVLEQSLKNKRPKRPRNLSLKSYWLFI